MPYLKASWFENEYRHGGALGVAAWYATNAANIDRVILSDAVIAGARTAEILTEDITGYLESAVLIEHGLNYAFLTMFGANWGITDSTADIYRAKQIEYKDKYDRSKANLTRGRIIYG